MGVWSDFMWTGVVFGGVGALSRESWPTIWMIIEINLLSFLPFIRRRWNRKNLSLLYFITQSVGSLALMSGGVVSDRTNGMTNCIMLGLLLKTSIAPFHFWGAAVVAKMNKYIAFVFLTWQKLTPIFLLIRLPKIMWILVLNMFVAASCCIGTKSLTILLFFSGLMHIIWVLSSTYLVSYHYFTIYVLILAPIILINYTPLLILNLGGLPPMTGFFMKLIVLQTVRIGYAVLLLRFTVVILSAYIRLFLVGPIKKSSYRFTAMWPCWLGILL